MSKDKLGKVRSALEELKTLAWHYTTQLHGSTHVELAYEVQFHSLYSSICRYSERIKTKTGYVVRRTKDVARFKRQIDKLAKEAFGKIACANCPGLCCRKISVSFRATEEEQKLADPTESFLDRWTYNDKDGKESKWLRECKFERLEDGDVPIYSCPKLKDGNCSVYKDRPQLCKNFHCGYEAEYKDTYTFKICVFSKERLEEKLKDLNMTIEDLNPDLVLIREEPTND